MPRRLVQLNYEVVYLNTAVSVNTDAELLMVQFGDFSCVVTPHELVATPASDYDDVAPARVLLEPYLEAWAAHSELFDYFPMTFRFSGQRYEQLPSTDGVVYGEAAAAIGIAFNATGHVQRNRLPEPRPDISIEGVVAAQLRRRWRGMEQGSEPVPAASYYIVTAVKRYFTSLELNISSKVIDELGRLSSIADPEHGRKADGHPGTLTADELMWMRTACRAIVQRVLEHEAGADTSRKITRDSLLP